MSFFQNKIPVLKPRKIYANLLEKVSIIFSGFSTGTLFRKKQKIAKSFAF